MAVYLDPQNSAFADAVSKQPPLYEKSPVEAREVLENIQNFKPTPDVKQETVKVSVKKEEVTTIIFRPANAQGMLHMILYTHGGGWILGRQAVRARTTTETYLQAAVPPCMVL